MMIGGGVGSFKASKAVLAVMMCALSVLPLNSALCANATTTLAVNIDPQPLEAALVELSRQGRLQLVVSTGSLPVKMSAALRGSMSLGAALDALLKDTGHTYKFVGEHTVAIVKMADRAGPISESSQAQVAGEQNTAGAGNAARGDRLMKPTGLLARLAAFFGICTASGTACAQHADASQSTNTFLELEEVIVTALRREETALKVPAALSVLSGPDMKTQGVNSVADLQNVLPALTVSRGQFGMNINMRGVQTTDFTAKGEQNIAYNIDGVYIGRPQAQAVSFFDIQRLEVLRGPQGTLYGRSAIAGAINVITSAPRLGERSGYAHLEYGNRYARRVEAAVNVPLGDAFAMRFSGAYNMRDGYADFIDQAIEVDASTYHFSAAGLRARNDQNDAAGRVSLLYSPGVNLTARVTANFGRQGGNAQTEAMYDMLEQHAGPNGLKILANPVPSWLDEHLFNVDGSLNWKFGAAQLDLLASQQHYTINDQITTTNNPAAYNNNFQVNRFDHVYDTTSFEARISNVDSGLLDYTMGANYFKEDIDEDYHGWNAPVATWHDQSTWRNRLNPFNNTQRFAWGVFAQATWHLTERFGVVAGARYTYDELERIGTLAAGPNWLQADGGPCRYPNPCVGEFEEGGADDDAITWRLGFNYQATPNNLFYAAAATGFKGGGFNDVNPADPFGGTEPYDPELLTSYELGYKGRPLPNLIYSTQLYFYDYEKQQINATFRYIPVGSVTPTNINYTTFGRSRIWGWENELTWQLARNTTLNGAASLADSEYVDYLAGLIIGQQVQWAGRELDKIPGLEGSLALIQAFDVANGDRFRLRLKSKYNSGYLLSFITNAVQYEQDSFWRSDASLGYYPNDTPYSVELFVENIENEVQKTSQPGNYNGRQGTADSVTPAAATPYGVVFGTASPRRYGVRFKLEF